MDKYDLCLHWLPGFGISSASHPKGIKEVWSYLELVIMVSRLCVCSSFILLLGAASSRSVGAENFAFPQSTCVILVC